MPVNLAVLYRLQEQESRLEELEADLASLDASPPEEKEFTEASAALEKAQAGKREVERLLKDAELQLAGVENERKQAQEKLYSGKITSSKELSQMEKDMEILKKKREKLDEQVLRRMDELDGAGKALAQAEEKMSAAKAGFENARAGSAERKARIAGQIEEARQKCVTCRQAVEPELLEKYLDVKERKGNPAVVRIRDESCGGCFMQVPQSAVQRARSFELVLCGSCGRILVS